LRQILTQLQNANIGAAWRSLSACCAARKRRPNDEGLEELLAFIETLVRINLFTSALAKHAATRIKQSARELAARSLCTCWSAAARHHADETY
jgi:hypothetical protein